MKSSSSISHDQVVDGSNIMELVENDQVFTNFVDHKFKELDIDCDGHLSVKELQPAVADLGAALGLPAQGSSPDSDHIYTEVVSQLVLKTALFDFFSDSSVVILCLITWMFICFCVCSTLYKLHSLNSSLCLITWYWRSNIND